MKKYCIFFDNFRPVIAKNLGVVYKITTTSNSIRYINLYGLYYIKTKDIFVYTARFINLSKELILRYNNECKNIDGLVEEMEEIGILNFEIVDEKIKSFESKKYLLGYNRYKDKILKRKSNNDKKLELINEINNLREDLIGNYANNETVFNK